MIQPIFLTLAEVLEIHADQLRRYGGQGGVRGLGLLESAIAQPEMSFAIEGRDASYRLGSDEQSRVWTVASTTSTLETLMHKTVYLHTYG